MSAVAEYKNVRDARDQFKQILDAADAGRPTTVARADRRVAAVDADRLVHFLTHTRPSEALMVAEADGWTVTLPGLPLAGDGSTVDEAIEETIDALRDYAEAWVDGLAHAPNHRENWGVVQIVALSSDDQLRDWLLA